MWLVNKLKPRKSFVDIFQLGKRLLMFWCCKENVGLSPSKTMTIQVNSMRLDFEIKQMKLNFLTDAKVLVNQPGHFACEG